MTPRLSWLNFKGKPKMPQLYLCDSGSGKADDGSFLPRGRLIECRYDRDFVGHVDAYLRMVDELHTQVQTTFTDGLAKLREEFHVKHPGAKLPDTSYE